MSDGTLLHGLPSRAVYEWDTEETSYMLETLGMGQFKQQVRQLWTQSEDVAACAPSTAARLVVCV